MPTVSKPFTFSAGAVIIASQHNSDFDTLYNLVNGSLDGTNLASNAAIADTQLNQITTPGKVAGAAITLASTTVVTAVSSDYVLIGDTSDSGNPKKALVSDLAFTPSATNALSGSVIQMVNTLYTSTTSTATTIPFDDTIPTSSEGAELTTLAITPKNSSNLLRIDAVVTIAGNTLGDTVAIALFQDSNAASVAVTWHMLASDYGTTLPLTFWMTAGTTSATTFKIRYGASSGTAYINSRGGTRKYGGVSMTTITITEIKA